MAVADYYYVIGDTLPLLKATAYDPTGAVVDWSTYTTINVVFKGRNTATVVTKTAVGTSAGLLTYTPAAVDFTVEDDYDFEFQCSKVGAVITVPSARKLVAHVRAKIS